MKVHVCLPTEILGSNLSQFWSRLYTKMQQEYRGATITSDYTGDGRIEDSDVVIFLYEFKDKESYKRDIQKCRDLNISYNFFTKYYAPDRFYYPSPTQE